MTLTLLVQQNCSSCTRTINQINQIIKNNKYVNLKIIDINEIHTGYNYITPALFIEDEFFNCGEINSKRLIKIIEEETTV